MSHLYIEAPYGFGAPLLFLHTVLRNAFAHWRTKSYTPKWCADCVLVKPGGPHCPPLVTLVGAFLFLRPFSASPGASKASGRQTWAKTVCENNAISIGIHSKNTFCVSVQNVRDPSYWCVSLFVMFFLCVV